MSEPLSPEQFDTLLQRLGPDRELAGTRYEQLRRRLVSLFHYRGCPHPEELADETLDRAARRLEEMGTEFVGSDPARFVYGVAWNVARESFRRRSTVPLPERWEGPGPTEPPGAEDEERERACLDRCLDRLPRRAETRPGLLRGRKRRPDPEAVGSRARAGREPERAAAQDPPPRRPPAGVCRPLHGSQGKAGSRGGPPRSARGDGVTGRCA